MVAPLDNAIALGASQRRRFEVRGLVQGVGFRPQVFRLAKELGLQGFVHNAPEGVVIEVEGARALEFHDALIASLPPLARVDELSSQQLEPIGEQGFDIRQSRAGHITQASIPADAALCEDCLAELFDPTDRRYLHPFIACTNCGPRFSMARQLPYDRHTTSMDDFELCRECAAEYVDAASRRFHAEPICCHHCGPQLSASLADMALVLRGGGIVAFKGIGGFHLTCDAHNDLAVARLRDNKRRDGKPLAVMVPNLASAGRYAEMNSMEAELLQSPSSPIVLSPCTSPVLLERVAPGLDSLGLMLPYTAVHYLLFYHMLGRPAGHDWLQTPHKLALVMTSANLSGDPLLSDNAEAETALLNVADHVLAHNRVIVNRIDDSVFRVAERQVQAVRRARGFVPQPIAVARDGAEVLALGAHLKNTTTLLRGEQAWLSAHIGDLETPATLAHQRQSVERLLDFLEGRPQAIACDLHPDYASTRLAENLAQRLGLPLFRVQHHHAHVAAVLAEHGHTGPALGVALDGHGLGADGTAWGGELLLLQNSEFERLGHWLPLPVPGGDKAAREPWRMAAGALALLDRGDEIDKRFNREPLAAPLQALLSQGEFSYTSAAGRWFDAAAGLLGICHRARYEGEAPMLLESLVKHCRTLPDGFDLKDGVLDFRPLLSALLDIDDPQLGAELVHGTFLDGLAAWVIAAARQSGVKTVALSGGCFLNGHLFVQLPDRLRDAGLTVLLPRQVPPNDGGLSLGQAWVARHDFDRMNKRN